MERLNDVISLRTFMERLSDVFDIYLQLSIKVNKKLQIYIEKIVTH